MTKKQKQQVPKDRTPSKAKAGEAVIKLEKKGPSKKTVDAKEANGAYGEKYRAKMVSMMLEKNISANQLSAQTGISQPTLSRWKRQAEAKARGILDPVSTAQEVEEALPASLSSMKDRVLMLFVTREDLPRVLAEAIG